MTMQVPTCSNIRIRSTQDAHKIFFAVQRRLLPLVTRRLDADERLALRSGCVYAWEERGPHTEITGLGIERFTEGRRWSPSRVRDEFLFYYEKYSPPQDAQQSSSSERDKQPPRDWDPLVKQTYSVWVETEKGRRKLHLTAYFTQATVDQLGTIDDIPGVGDLSVPDGLFQSTRVSKNRKADDSRGRSNDVFKPPASTVTRTYAPFPSMYSGPPVPSHHDPRSAPHSSHGYDSYQHGPNYSHTHATPYYHSDAQLPQYSVPPPLPPNPYALPPIRSNYDVHHDHHHRSAPPYQHSTDLMYGRRASIDLPPTRVRSASYCSASGSGAEDAQPSGITGPPHYPSPLPSSNDTRHSEPEPASSRLARSVSAGGESSSSLPPPPWYPSERQSTLFPPRSELPTSYPLRPSYPSTTGQPPPPPVASSNMSYSYQYSYPSYRSDHGDSQTNSQTNSPPPSDHRLSPTSTPSLPRLSPPPSAQGLPVPFYDTTPAARASSSSGGESSRSIGPCRRDLAPLHSLQRSHPYRRDPVDDKALRLLRPRPA